MKVESIYSIRTRGFVASVTLEDEFGPQPGDTLRRGDGKSWTIVGVEWFAMTRSPTRPGRGDTVGLLLSAEEWHIAEGDAVTIERVTTPRHAQSSTALGAAEAKQLGIRVGDRIGVRSHPSVKVSFHGAHGTILEMPDELGRYGVHLDGAPDGETHGMRRFRAEDFELLPGEES
jgi:hypothetical protein